MSKYIQLGRDMKPHIFGDPSMFGEEKLITTWNAEGVIKVSREVFDGWLFKPHQIGDTFSLLGFDFIIVHHPSDDYHAWIPCRVWSEAYELHTLFRLLHETEMKLWWFSVRPLWREMNREFHHYLPSNTFRTPAY